jgi:hypothetical protein
MDAAPPSPDWEATVKPWSVAVAMLAGTQGAAIAAALVFVLSRPAIAGVAMAAAVALEGVKRVLEHLALARIPGFDFDALYASAPLERPHRILVVFNLALMPLVALALFAISPAAGLIGLVTILLSAPSLYRVWRRNSWLAISRLPLRPRVARNS